jgi:hypothetical protein
MQFKVCNIEEDPKSQGFSPDQFDVVIAANVLHATRDLAETCRNIRILMKNFGVLLIGETFIPQLSIDVSFGMLPGYWGQLDSDLRPKHCVIDANKWSELLSKTGFTDNSLIVPTNGGRTGVVLAKASGLTEQYTPPVPINTEIVSNNKNAVKNIPNTWLVFGEPTDLSQNLTKRMELHGKSVIEAEADFQILFNSLK